MKNVTLGLIAAVGASVLAAGAIAGESGKGGKGFDRFDVNGDGVITEADSEARVAARAERRSARLMAADENGDGSVSREEWKAHREAKRAARNPDKNADGVIDRDEYVLAAQARFDRLDKNGDGVLSDDEKRRRHGRRGHHGRRDYRR